MCYHPQEQNQLSVVHERPNAWSNYFYRLQQGKVVTTFYSKVNSSTICVPCTYRELQESKAILPAELQNLPEVDPSKNQSLVLAEVSSKPYHSFKNSIFIQLLFNFMQILLIIRLFSVYR